MAAKKSILSTVSGLFGRRGISVGVTGSAAMADAVDYGVSVTNDSALKVTAFYAGIRIISENIASLPKQVRRRTARGLVPVKDHPVTRLLNHPNAYTNKLVFWMTMATWLKDWGNAYALIEFAGNGEPVALHQIAPDCMRVTLVNGRKWYQVSFADPDFQHLNGIYSDDRVLHFMELSKNGITGVNPVVYNAAALGKSLATEKFAGEYFRKGGNVKAVLETEGELGDKAYENFINHFGAAAQNFSTPLLEYGIKYKAIGVNPISAQLLQSETFSIQDVCRILGIPPHMVADLSHATFSNIEHQTIQFVQYTLRPIVKKFEVELESKLFSDEDRDEYSIKFSLDGLLRGDTATRSQYYHNAILDGYLSRNEVRELEGYESKEGLDDMLFPLNSGVVGKDKPKNEE